VRKQVASSPAFHRLSWHFTLPVVIKSIASSKPYSLVLFATSLSTLSRMLHMCTDCPLFLLLTNLLLLLLIFGYIAVVAHCSRKLVENIRALFMTQYYSCWTDIDGGVSSRGLC